MATVGSLTRKLEWWHLALVLIPAGLVWRALGAPGQPKPMGDEDIQRQARDYALPTEFWHFSPVSWAGRCHPYPRGVGEMLKSQQVPDWSDVDR